jgi:CO/xanthine dehydrogenase Mo-binding subunit
MTGINRMSRRDFLAVTGVAGAGLLLSMALPIRDDAAAIAAQNGTSGFAPDILLQIARNGTVTIWVFRSEMGQGVRTGLPMIIAEELGARWEDVRIEQAPGANDGRYGPQLTGGSYSVRSQYDRLRRVGAVARELLIAAAAREWSVDPGGCAASQGEVIHGASGRTARFGDLVDAAAELPVPDAEGIPLKDPSDFQIIGSRLSRVDQQDYILGRARFGVDTRVPGMRYAAVARCPYVGGKLLRYDEAAAMRVPGVRQVVEYEGRHDRFYIAPGVAVIADDTWAAMQGARALSAVWDSGPNANASTEELGARFNELAEQPGDVLRDDGETARVLSGATEVVEARYEIPFLAHATMEPMNCTIRVEKDECEIWTPSQNPQTVQRLVATYLDLPEDKVTVHVTLIGGGFGRRLYPDPELEAAGIARHVDGPIQVMWTRKDDIRHDRFRPSSLHVLRGAVDSGGLPSAWHWRILNTHTDRFDPEDFPAFCVPNYRVEYTHVPFILPRGAWRATTNSYNPTVVQAFVDELAGAAGRDPVEFRLDMLRRTKRTASDDSPYDNGRMMRVVETVAEKADWGSPLPPGTGRGVAFNFGYESYVAEVVEVQIDNGEPVVRRVVCAVDCGEVINPDLVEAQCEGAITFALSAALMQKITVANGRVQEQNFSDYPILKIGDMPEIETHIIESHAAPGGMGEVPLPPLAPALANAIFDATGKRVRRFPIVPR